MVLLTLSHLVNVIVVTVIPALIARRAGDDGVLRRRQCCTAYPCMPLRDHRNGQRRRADRPGFGQYDVVDRHRRRLVSGTDYLQADDHTGGRLAQSGSKEQPRHRAAAHGNLSCDLARAPLVRARRIAFQTAATRIVAGRLTANISGDQQLRLSAR